MVNRPWLAHKVAGCAAALLLFLGASCVPGAGPAQSAPSGSDATRSAGVSLAATPTSTVPSVPATTGTPVGVMPTTAGATATPGDRCTTYVVIPGDTLSDIAARCGTTVEAIVQANVAITDPNRILVDQTLTIPGAAG